MKSIRDIKVGEEFGKWTVLALAPRMRGGRCLCRCVCGNEGRVPPFDLVSDKSTKCRTCANEFARSKRKKKWPSADNRHLRRLRTVVIHAISRCTKTSHARYADWGGRGIKVHPLWVTNPLLFVEYLTTLEGASDQALLLDRIDNDGHYEPGNLRFVTRSESQLNRRNQGGEHGYYIRHGFARRFKRLHDTGVSFKEIGELYCAQQATVRNCVRELETVQ